MIKQTPRMQPPTHKQRRTATVEPPCDGQQNCSGLSQVCWRLTLARCPDRASATHKISAP